MRLYRLVARLGYVKKRLYPWFDAPVADAPREYLGWVWDSVRGEYVETDIAGIIIELDVPRYPEPTQSPRPAQPLYVPGWYWNGRAGVWEETTMPFADVLVTPERPPAPTEVPSRAQPAEVPGWRYNFGTLAWEEIPMEPVTEMVEEERPLMPEYSPGVEQLPDIEGWSYDATRNEWVATILIGEPMEFEPPPTLPPGAEKLTEAAITPTDAEMITFFRQLMRDGLSWDTANMIVQFVKDGWLTIAAAKSEHAAELYWRAQRENIKDMVGQVPPVFKVAALYAALAVGIALLVATIISRLFRTDREYVSIVGGITTYLLGPDNWTYSRDIGRSIKGHRYFSECDGIGTEDVRHRRGYGIGQFDYIDFPGGFVESGFKFPYFVKYTWERWELVYMGMLERVGARWYVLKAVAGFYEMDYPFAQVLPFEDWCLEFRFYL